MGHERTIAGLAPDSVTRYLEQTVKLHHQDPEQWHPVPYAWVPMLFENVTYWLEQPPYQRRAKWWHPFTGFCWEYRKCA